MRKKSVLFKDCFKKYTTDQDKAISPRETLDAFYEKVESLDLKILNEVKRIDNGRLDIPVYFSVCGEDAFSLTGTKKQMGKGASPVQAEASACMELAERFSFFSFKSNEENFITGDYKSMVQAGYPVLDLQYLLLSVHDTRTGVDQLKLLLDEIPMQWTWATNISTGKDILLPFSWFFAINEFNGPSAGNTIEEAALQGICEIVERHVCSLVNNDKRETPAIDKNTVKDTIGKRLIDTFAENGIDLYLNDFTLDTGICTVAALAVDRATFPAKSEIVFTAGTTPDPEKAIIRAVTEVAQLAGDFNSGSNYIASGLPKPGSMEEVAYLTETGSTVSVEEMVNFSDNNMRVEIDNCVDALKEIGMEIFMIDATLDGLKIPALYTIIPGAHFRERSRINDAGLFAAKLVMDLVTDPELLEGKFRKMEEILSGAYYLEFYRGRNLLNMGHLEPAVKHFKNALALNPEQEDLPYIYSYLGSCLKDLGEIDEAVSIIQHGLEEDEERPDMHNTLGVCYFKKQQYYFAQARIEYRQY
ncbi:MAG: YcaO-like family protein [Deltaproteobacteria bacterium]|nr:YcaO-like family protein [Deltaproteobacteria bacterium]